MTCQDLVRLRNSTQVGTIINIIDDLEGDDSLVVVDFSHGRFLFNTAQLVKVEK